MHAATQPVTVKSLFGKTRMTQVEIAAALDIGTSALNLIINKGIWPRMNPDEVDQRLRDFLTSRFTEDQVTTAFEHLYSLKKGIALKPNSEKPAGPSDSAAEEENMLLPKTTLTQQTGQHFKVFRNPFAIEVSAPEQLYLGLNFNYVRQALWHAAKTSSLIAITGESGSGKTTLKQDLFDRIQREKLKVVVIEPYIIASALNNGQGKVLKTMGIAEAIIKTLGFGQIKAKRSIHSQWEQVHELLLESSRAGYSHLLLLEEAHSLTNDFLRQLKRLLELQNGYKKLLSIVIIGQPELLKRLNERNYELREFVQRCEFITLEPIASNELENYLKHCLEQSGVSYGLDHFIDGKGIQAMVTRMQQKNRSGEITSLLYPLAIGNFMAAAMNQVVKLKGDVITAGVVAQV